MGCSGSDAITFSAPKRRQIAIYQEFQNPQFNSYDGELVLCHCQ